MSSLSRPGTGFTIPAGVLLLAGGFVHGGLVRGLNLKLEGRGNASVHRRMTSGAGIFAAGDTVRGACPVVHATRKRLEGFAFASALIPCRRVVCPAQGGVRFFKFDFSISPPAEPIFRIPQEFGGERGIPL